MDQPEVIAFVAKDLLVKLLDLKAFDLVPEKNACIEQIGMIYHSLTKQVEKAVSSLDA